MAKAGISPERPLRDAFGVDGAGEASYGLILYEGGIWLAQGMSYAIVFVTFCPL